MNHRGRQRKIFKGRMRSINRVILMGSAVMVPLYFLVRFSSGSVDSLGELPGLLGRIKEPIVWQVPEGGVRYIQFHHGQPDEGSKFVTVELELQARMKIGYPVVPRCFRLVDDEGTRHYPMARSQLFIDRGVEFRLERDDEIEGELLFQIPQERQAVRLLFDRYSDSDKED
jgi:hypothetical protein